MSKKKSYFLEWLIYIVFYALVLIIVSYLFPKTLYIDSSDHGIYYILASIIISTLNLTIKPLLVFITLPITALTLGLFYPVINVLILELTDILLGTHFDIKGFIMSIIVAITISLLNKIIKESILKRVLKGE